MVRKVWEDGTVTDDSITADLNSASRSAMDSASRGLQARQVAAPEHAPLGHRIDQHKLSRATGSDLTSHVQQREVAENERFRSNLQRINEILGDTDPFTGQAVPGQKRKGGGLTHEDLFEGLDENDLGSVGIQGSWEVVPMEARTKDGSVIPVWKVMMEGAIKMEFPHMFRLESAAQRAWSILNQTGNVNDQRLVQLIESEKQYTMLMKRARVLKESAMSGDAAARTELMRVKGNLDALALKLGSF